MTIRPAETDLPLGSIPANGRRVYTSEFGADDHQISLANYFFSEQLVPWEGRFNIGYVCGQCFIGDVLSNDVRGFRLAAQCAKIIGDQCLFSFM